MDVREWSLIAFTLLMQGAIGTTVLAVVLRQVSADAGMKGVYERAVTAMVPVGVLALLASLGHLGRPGAAFNALAHLGTSWLSREVFFSGGFVVLLLLAALLHGSAPLANLLRWLAAACGVASLISMSSLYTVTAMPAWQGFNTYVAFAGTTLLLGAAVLGAMVASSGRRVDAGAAGGHLGLLVWVAVVAVLGQLLALPVYLASLGAGDGAAQASAALLAGAQAPWVVLRWALVLVGGLVPLLVVWRREAALKVAPPLVYTALAAIAAGELVGRYLFYATAVPIGIGIGIG